MISKYFWLFIISFFSCARVQAQFYETIRSARPGQSIGVSTMGKNVFQIQSGVDYFGAHNADLDLKTSGFLTNTALRFGLTEMFEVGTFFEYKNESTTSNDVTSSLSGLSNLILAIRHQISVGEGLIPSVGFQLRLRLPVLSDPYQIDHLAPSFVFVTSQQLSKSWTLITNLGGSWNGNNSIPTTLYTVNLSWAFTSEVGVFIENYGSITQGTFDTRMDAGLAWLVTPDLQLDLLGGYGSNHGLQDYFISTGVSWRTNRTKNP